MRALRPRTRANAATIADPAAHASGLWLAAQAGHLRGARLAARRGRSAVDEGEPGLADRAAVPRAGAVRAHFLQAVERGKRAEDEWNDDFAPTSGPFPISPGNCASSCAANCPAGWDADIPAFPADAKGMATRVASGKIMNAIAPRLPALIGGSADLDPSTHTALKGLGDFEPSGACRRRRAGLRRRRLVVRGPQPAFRRARARDGRDRERHGGARRHRAVRRDVPRLLRLHAPADPPRRPDGIARDLRLHPRQHRAGRGRPDAPAGRAARRPARDSAPDRHPPGRRQRDRRGVARCRGNARPAGGAGVDAAERADARPRAVFRRRRACGAAPTSWPMPRTAIPT